MNLQPIPRAEDAERVGLGRTTQQPLNQVSQQRLDAAMAQAGGGQAWWNRKRAEARDLLALESLVPRMKLEWLDLTADLRALIRLDAPVPVRPRPSGGIEAEPQVLLGLRYYQEAVFAPQSGASFVQILEPADGVFLGQVPDDPPYVLCLAPTLPAGIPCRELVFLAYMALTLRSFQLDERHPGGVFNAEAALWWQANSALIPLSTEPFLLPTTSGDHGPSAPDDTKGGGR